MYRLEPAMIEALPEHEQRPTREERSGNAGCHIVAGWSTFRTVSAADRVKTGCANCPLYNGRMPPSIPVFATALKHIRLQKLGLAPGRDEYTPREIAAILYVDGEIERKKQQLRDEKRSD